MDVEQLAEGREEERHKGEAQRCETRRTAVGVTLRDREAREERWAARVGRRRARRRADERGDEP